MDRITVQDIDISLNLPELIEELKVSTGGNSMIDRFRRTVAKVSEISRPKGLYRPVEVEHQEEAQVIIDGILFKSRVLAVQLEDVHRVFPFVATCGEEAAVLARDCTSMIERFWMETILDKILQRAVTRTREDMAKNFQLKKTALMTPGSLDDWPLQEQAQLFAVLGDVTAETGVRLLDSFMMSPRQSISGIVFPAEVDFQTCMLCGREKCPKRRAPYDQHLYDRRFRKK